MLIRSKIGWELPESAATPESIYLDRRRLIQGLAAGPILLAGSNLFAGEAFAAETPSDPSVGLYPVKRNELYKVDRPITAEKDATSYNNFYEFGSHKRIARAAQSLPIRPWTVTLDGMVEKEQTVDIDDLLKRMPLEERVYRHRCVEAWSMTVPWSGFPMRALVDFAKPLTGAKYVKMETFVDKDVASGQRQPWYPWPYIEGLSMAEAMNELTFMVTGLYGKPVPRQNGAPLRLATPWKYGFKSIKGIVSIEFTDIRPVSFWEQIQSREYGFWANVNPEVPHPRWSQATERVLGVGKRVPTQLYNGYEEYVADMYANMSGEKLYL